MTKSELIETISSVNRSATREFLSGFSQRELADYVRQLDSLGLVPRAVADRVTAAERRPVPVS